MVTCNEIYDMYQHRNPESEIHQAFREVATDDKDSMYDNRTPLHLACHFADVEAVRILLDDDFNLIFVLDALRQGVFWYVDSDSLFGKDGSLLPCLQHHQKACAGNPVSGFIEEL